MSRASEPSSAEVHVRRTWAIAAHLSAGTRGYTSGTTAGVAGTGNTASYHQTLVDVEFFNAHGWVIVPSVVSREAVQKVADEIATLLKMDLSNPSDWYNDSGGAYGEKPLEIGAGMVELYQSQGQWDNRTAPKVHQAFAEVLGSEKLLVTMDRCNFKPPVRSADDPWNTGLPLHWDGPRPGEAGPFLEELSVQGALLLSDVSSGGGGFMCVDGFHKEWEEWGLCTEEGGAIKGAPFADQPFAARKKAIEVTGQAGDLLIWNRLLPHGSLPNTSPTPRLAQFISMYRADAAPRSRRRFGVSLEEELHNRVQLWQKKKLGSYSRWEGHDGGRWQEDGMHPEGPSIAKLSDLGLKLLGIEPWE